MKAWSFETKIKDGRAIIIFAENKVEARSLGLDNELLYGYTQLKDAIIVKRNKAFDRYYPLFIKEKYISWHSKKGERAYWEQEWNLNGSYECIECGRAEYNNVKESTLFTWMDEDGEEREFCYDCICYNKLSVIEDEKQDFDKVKSIIEK